MYSQARAAHHITSDWERAVQLHPNSLNLGVSQEAGTLFMKRRQCLLTSFILLEGLRTFSGWLIDVHVRGR